MMKKKRECHGLQDTAEYRAWAAMIRRCENKNWWGYKFYGGRGVRVCQKWRMSFLVFLEDVGMRPNPKLTLDRIDNKKGYRPGNVKWSTMKEQCRNRRSNRIVRFRGKRMLVTEWAEHLGVNRYSLQGRFFRGWNAKRALTEPFRTVVKHG